MPPENADKIVAALSRRIGSDAETLATRIFVGVGVEMAKDIAMALYRRLLQGGSRPAGAEDPVIGIRSRVMP